MTRWEQDSGQSAIALIIVRGDVAWTRMAAVDLIRGRLISGLVWKYSQYHLLR